MSDQSYAVNSIMAYVGADDAVVGLQSGAVALAKWDSNELYFFNEGNAADDGIRKFALDVPGNELLQHNMAQLSLTAGTFVSSDSGGAAALTVNQYIAFINDPANSSILTIVYGPTLTHTADFGIKSSDTSASGTTRILNPWSFVQLRYGTADFLIAGSARQVGEICAIPVSAFNTNAVIGNLDEVSVNGVLLGPGITGSGGTLGTAFAVGLPFAYGSGPSAAAIGLYIVGIGGTGSVDVDGIRKGTLTKIGTITPANVDAAWTRFDSVAGIAYDQTDGHPIICVSGDAGGAITARYVVKLHKTTAVVVWKVAVNAAPPTGDTHFARSRIQNQRLMYAGSGGVLYTIDTNAGTATNQTISGLVLTGPQISDDVTNSLIMYGDFAPGATPDFLGTYMGAGGHHTLSNMWFRFWFATTQPAEGTGGNQGGLAYSKIRAWTYTLDQHTFYVLDLTDEGTFLYDVSTQQWTKFITAGFGQWNVQVGCMWGKRVVGGDLSTTDVWEVVATARTDNGTDIAHVATGGLQTRLRDKVDVAAVRVSASVGQLGNSTSAPVKLRFSDDNARSWSPYYTVTLLSGDYGAEIAYRALGSFAAPGRVFELSDTGGPVSIYGADAEGEELDRGNNPAR